MYVIYSKSTFVIVIMLTLYKCYEIFTPWHNIYRDPTVEGLILKKLDFP
jgi:hypothetical protein